MEYRDLCRQLRMLNNAIRRFVDSTSRLKREADNLTCYNGWIIAFLYDAEREGRQVMQRDLENEFGVTRSTASRMLILLEKKGVITREGVSHDARQKRVVLTEHSRELGERIRAEGDEMARQITAGFSEEELAVLDGYLARLMNNIENANSMTEKENTIC